MTDDVRLARIRAEGDAVSKRTDRDTITREMRDNAMRVAKGAYTIQLKATGRGKALPQVRKFGEEGKTDAVNRMIDAAGGL